MERRMKRGGAEGAEAEGYIYLYYDCLNGPIRLIYSRLINSTFT